MSGPTSDLVLRVAGSSSRAPGVLGSLPLPCLAKLKITHYPNIKICHSSLWRQHSLNSCPLDQQAGSSILPTPCMEGKLMALPGSIQRYLRPYPSRRAHGDIPRSIHATPPPFFILFYFIFLLFRATPEAYGDSQARGRMGAAAASPHHSHSNARSKLCL